MHTLYRSCFNQQKTVSSGRLGVGCRGDAEVNASMIQILVFQFARISGIRCFESSRDSGFRGTCAVLDFAILILDIGFWVSDGL